MRRNSNLIGLARFLAAFLLLSACSLKVTDPSAAPGDPSSVTVHLDSTSGNFPYQSPIPITVTFSQSVTGFTVGAAVVTNASVAGLTGSGASYILTLTPSGPGAVTLQIPAGAAQSGNAASAVLSVTYLNPALPPSANFTLTDWYLTLPTGTAGDPNTVKNLVGYTDSPYFFTGTDGSLTFSCPTNGVTTSGTDNPRSELRETRNGSNYNWSLSTYTTNTLAATLSVSQVPDTGQIVIGQIHDVGGTDGASPADTVADEPLIKLEYDSNPTDKNGGPCNGCIYAETRATPATATGTGTGTQVDYTIVTGIPLNTPFSYSITLTRTGLLTTVVNDTSYNLQLNTSANYTVGWGDNLSQNILSGGGLYFKAGDYVQSDTQSPVYYGTTKFYSLLITHQ
jgi:hypothetical protein